MKITDDNRQTVVLLKKAIICLGRLMAYLKIKIKCFFFQNVSFFPQR